MTDKMLNVLLVEDDEVDVMNVQRASTFRFSWLKTPERNFSL